VQAHDIVPFILAIIGFAAVSRRLEALSISLPMFFTGFGYVVGHVFGFVEPATEAGLIHSLAEFTLIVVLFSDASRIRLRALAQGYVIPSRMLLIGLPLTVLAGTLFTHWFMGSPWAMALLVGAILAPTDAALGQAVVTSPAVPADLRQAITVESGLNDGLVVPIVTIAALLAVRSAGLTAEGVPDNLAVFAVLQLTLGPAAGAAIGFGAARTLDFVTARELSTPVFHGIFFLAVAALAYFVAELVGGNGFIAAFIGGLTFGNALRSPSTFIDEFMEAEGQLLMIATFLIFGAVLLPVGIEHASWRTVVAAGVFLTIARGVPVWLSLSGLGLPTYSRVFLCWFGPRGLASVLFALVVFERYDLPQGHEALACVVLTVVLSVILHGITAGPMSRHFGATSDGER